MKTTFGRRFVAGLCMLAVLMSGSCRFETGVEEDLRGSIENMLTESAEAWNRGDLDAYLEFYALASSTTFMTGDGPVTGIDAIREVYAPLFDGRAPRDSLRFEDLSVRTFPPLVAVATLRYVLHGNGAETPTSGWATLVLRRTGDGWRIVHDHSS